MKNWSLVFFLILLIQNQQSLADDGFVTTKRVQFMLNGSPFYANGFNAYWLLYFATDPSQRNKVTSVFEEAKEHGLTIARTWAFNDGQDRALQTSPGSYNEQAFQVIFILFMVFSSQKLVHDVMICFYGCVGFGLCNIRSKEIWD